MLFSTFKQEATVVLTNLRDPMQEHARQMEQVMPKVVFLETRLLDTYT